MLLSASISTTLVLLLMQAGIGEEADPLGGPETR